MSDKVTLSNEELIERCDKWIVDLCKDRKNWTLSVPVQFNRDPDTLFTELIRRFKAALHPSESAGMNYLEFEKAARKFWRMCYGKAFPYKFSEWVWENRGSFSESAGVAMRPEDHEQVEVNQAAGMSEGEASFQAGYGAGHDAGYEKGKRESAVTGAVWVYTSDVLPKKEANVLCEYFSGDYGKQEYHGPEDWWKRNVKRWLNESPAAAQSGKEEAAHPNKEDALAFAEWILSREYYAEGGRWWVDAYTGDAKSYTTTELYNIFKQSK